MRRFLATASSAVLLTACGAAPEEEPPAAGPQRYAADAMVLEEHGEDGPWLCVGAIAASLPPQCGDAPLDGWDWDAVEGEETMSGTTWGDYRVVGTFDGERFAVEEVLPPTPPQTESDYEPTPSPCEEPAGGWLVGDPEAADQSRTQRAGRYASRQPDFVASWVTQLSEDPYANAAEGPLPVLYNAVFTGDAERHEAAIRQVWAGPLCVVEREVATEPEARTIAKEAERTLAGLGLKVMMVAPGGVQPSVDFEVIADPGGRGQATVDDLYGPGVVRVTALLETIP